MIIVILCLNVLEQLQCLYILVNKIKQNREVTINIPDESYGSAIIRIEGNKQGVDEAKAVRLIFNFVLRNYLHDDYYVFATLERVL